MKERNKRNDSQCTPVHWIRSELQRMQLLAHRPEFSAAPTSSQRLLPALSSYALVSFIRTQQTVSRRFQAQTAAVVSRVSVIALTAAAARQTRRAMTPPSPHHVAQCSSMQTSFACPWVPERKKVDPAVNTSNKVSLFLRTHEFDLIVPQRQSLALHEFGKRLSSLRKWMLIGLNAPGYRFINAS